MEEEEDVLQLDEYIILNEVGLGAQGRVYKAQNEKTGEIQAIKEIKRNSGERLSSDVRTEIAVMKRLNHPNVAKFIAVYENPDSPGYLYLVLEFVEGGSLYSDSTVWTGISQTEILNFDRVQGICQQLVRGISYLHYMGVLHRDIKPSNVLGDKYQGLVKLSDFGVSCFTNRRKSSRLLGEDDIVYVGSCGTPAFLPPEASGAGFDNVYHAKPAEVWSLGVTFYFLLFGVLPFRGENRMDTCRLICESPLNFPSKLSGPIKDLLVRMLEKDPSKRATLAMVSRHSWIQVENWKVDETSFPDLTTDDLEHSISSARFKKRTRRKSILEGMRKAVSSIGRRRSISGEGDSNLNSSDNDLKPLISSSKSLDETESPATDGEVLTVPKGMGRKLFLSAIHSDQ